MNMRFSVVLAAGLLWTVTAAEGAAAEGVDKNPGHLKMALVNIKCLYSDGADPAANQANIRANLKRHCDFIDRIAPDNVEFIGFPELSINGYHFSNTMTWLRLDGPEVGVLQQKAAEKGLYISAGIAEQDASGKKWNTQIIIGPDGKIVGWHHKLRLTKEEGYTAAGTEHNVFLVKGVKIGISTCADGSEFANLKALADAGAQIIYGPHANTTGGTIFGWYHFRSKWGGAWDGQQTLVKLGKKGPEIEMPSGGWIAQLKVCAALHNHAALYNPDYGPPAGKEAGGNWASGAWFIGPDGQTLAQMPPSTERSDSKEFILICNLPVAGR
jgi:hypothetical protein